MIRRHSTGSNISSSQIPIQKQAVNHNIRQSKSEKTVTNKNTSSAQHVSHMNLLFFLKKISKYTQYLSFDKATF